MGINNLYVCNSHVFLLNRTLFLFGLNSGYFYFSVNKHFISKLRLIVLLLFLKENEEVKVFPNRVVAGRLLAFVLKALVGKDIIVFNSIFT